MYWRHNRRWVGHSYVLVKIVDVEVDHSVGHSYVLVKIVDVEVDHNYLYWCTSMSYCVPVKPPVLDWTIIIGGEVADAELDHNYVAVQ